MDAIRWIITDRTRPGKSDRKRGTTKSITVPAPQSSEQRRLLRKALHHML